MTQLATTAPPGVLDTLAGEARFYSEAAANNLFQLARVLTEAKKLVPHGQWGAWVEQNAGCSERTAQQMMQAYTRYGDRPEVARLDRSKVFKLLALPEPMEQTFFAENDVQAMTAREVAEAVKEAVEIERMKMKMEAREAQKRFNMISMDADQQRVRAEKAEMQLKQMLADPPVPEDIAQRIAAADGKAEDMRREMERMSAAATEALEETNALRRQNTALQLRVKELDAELADADAMCDHLQSQIRQTGKQEEDALRVRLIDVEIERLQIREERLRVVFEGELKQIRQERRMLEDERRMLA